MPSPQIPIVVCHLVLLEKHEVFFLKRGFAVMLHLVGNIGFDCGAMRQTDCKGAISWLPGEIAHADAFVNPSRRTLFNVLNECGNGMSRAQANQQMNMIRRAANRLRDRIRVTCQTAQIFMQPLAPSLRDERMSVFGGEDQMKVKA